MGVPYKDVDTRDNNGGQSGQPKFIIDTLSASPYNSANEFNFQLQSGKLKFVNLHAKLSGSYPLDKFLVPNTWKTRFSMDNSKTLTILRPIVITRLEDDVVFIPETAENLEYEIEFEHITTTPATSSAFLTSYADVTFGNLRTFSGDVSKVKLFGRQQDKQNAEFEKFGEFALETKNELKDSTSVTGNDPIGVFYSQSVVDNFWETSSAQPIQISNTQIMNSVLVSGSNYADGNFVEFKTKKQFELEKNEEYIVSFQSYFIKKDKQQADGSVRKSAEIEVFLSGSVISQTGETLSLGSVSDFGDNASELLKGNVSGSIPRLYNYFTTHKKSGIKPKAGLVFRVNAGEFYISNVRLEPVSDRNFNPGFYKTIVPMPIGSRRGQRYDFVSEFYDSNNNKADFEAVTSASVLFAGAPQVLADGTDAVLSGSVQIGDSMEMYGVNPAYLRSIGYNGFDKTIAGTGDRNGGFMLWSGSIGSTIGASETYNGVGLEVVDASSTNKHEHAFLQFASNYKGTGNPRFRVQTNEFLLGRSGSGAAETFISGSQGKLRISSSNFHLDDDGAVTMQGTITATAGGTIGGFTIGSDNLTATNFVLNTTDKSLSMGSGNTIFIADADTGIQLGHATFGSAPFRVTPAGVLTATSATIQGAITATSGEIGGFNINTNTLTSDSNELVISGSSGRITGSQVLFTGGKIGGFEIVNSVDAIRSVDKSLILSGSGQITGSSVLFTGGKIGGFELSSTTLSATNFTIDTSGKSISLGSGNNVFIADADTGIQLGHATFGSAPFRVSPTGALTATSATIQGAITATSGEVGGFTIDADEIKAGSTLILDSNTNSGQIKLGGATSIIAGSDGIYMDGTGDFRVGDADGERISFDASAESLVISSSTFMIGSKADGKSFISASDAYGLEISSSNFHLSASGKITASAVKLSGDITAQTGNIGGFTIDADEIKSGTTFILDSDTSSGQIKIGASGGPGSATGTSNAGAYIDGTGKFNFVGDANNFIRFNSSGLEINTAKFDVNTDGEITATGGTIGGFTLSTNALTATNFSLDPSNKRITLGTGTNIFIADGDEGIQLGNGTFANAPFSVTKAGVLKAEQGFIGGFAITSGSIETTDFASGLKGLRLSTAANGTIEAENARIRGTLATTVFEKETVNAVGGQLLIANSTAITSSAFHSLPVSASQTTMSVVNVTGFAANEILLIKKVGDTGFSTEYVKVVSASRDVPSSDKNFSGRLFVNRAINSGSMSSAGMFMESGSSAQTYENGQVLVSTGKEDTGFIKLNANPNDVFTPYIDIVERTGSAVYDIDLKARLGDLSGLSSGLVGSNPGFGLFSENVFLTGKITATSGEIGGLTIASDKVHVGTGTHGNSNTAFYVDDSGKFSLKDKLVWDGSTLNIDGTLSVGSLPAGTVSSSAQLASDISGSSAAGLASLNAITGSILDKTGSIDLQVARVVINNSGMTMRNSSDVTVANIGSTIILGTTGSNEENVVIDSDSVDIRSGTTSLSDFGSTVRIGKSGQARTEITDTAISMYDGQGTPRKRVAINNAGVIAVGGASGADVSVSSTDEVVRIDSSGVNIFNDSDNFTFVSGSGMSVFSGGDKVAQFASEVKIGDFEDATKSFVKIDGDSLDIMAGSVVTASFGATTTLGNTSNEHIQISGSGIELKDGGTQKLAIQNSGVSIGTPGESRTEITDTKISMFSGQSTPRKRVEIDSDGIVALGGATGADVSVTSTDDCIRLEPNSGITIFSDSNNKSVVDANGLTVTQGGNEVATFGSTVRIGKSGQARTEITDTAISMYDGQGTPRKRVAINNAGVIAIGGASGADVSVSSTDEVVRIDSSGVNIFNDSNNFTFISGSGMSVFSGGNKVAQFASEVKIGDFEDDTKSFVKIDGDSLDIMAGTTVTASFGATTTIGNTATEHISISSTELKIKDGNGSGTDIDYVTINSSGMSIGNNISLGTNGNATFSGNVQIGSGESVFKADSNGIYLGNETFGSAEFRVTPAGALTSTSATITGAITATSGVIGGWNIDGTSLKSNDNSIVLDEGNDIIKVVGTSAGVGGASLATSAELFNDGSVSGSSFRILKDGMDGSTDVPIIKINSSQQYMTGDIDNDYTTNVDKKSVAFTNTGTGDANLSVSFSSGDTTWPSNNIIGYMGAKGTGATNGLICQMAANTGSFNLLDTQEDNNVVEIVVQNLRESVVLGSGSGNNKSRYQWKAEIYQSDTNSASPADVELVGSFKISSLLAYNASNQAVTSATPYVLNKRYFFVSFKGWGYDALTNDVSKDFKLDFAAAPISATQYLPKTRMTALGLQSYAGPNQNAMFGAKNEIVGDYMIRKAGASPNKTRGNIQVEGKASIGTIEIDDTFTLYTEGEIGASGNITAFYSSDKRLKENVIEIKDGLSLVNQLRPVKFDWKDDSPFAHLKPTEYGLIAQEVEEVIPEVVGNMKQDYKGVKYEGLVPLLIQSIKDLTKRVEELEERFIRK